jgi:hypothetical protein
VLHQKYLLHPATFFDFAFNKLPRTFKINFNISTPLAEGYLCDLSIDDATLKEQIELFKINDK